MDVEQEWTRVNQVMELVKQEGDANCEAAFDFLLATLAVAREEARVQGLMEAALIASAMIEELAPGMAPLFAAAMSQAVEELITRLCAAGPFEIPAPSG